jgi:hypothetical protein
MKTERGKIYRGYLFKIPIFIRCNFKEIPEVWGRNRFWDCILKIIVFIVEKILFVKEFPIEIED